MWKGSDVLFSLYFRILLLKCLSSTANHQQHWILLEKVMPQTSCSAR